MNPFDVLEIKPSASADDIKTAYHRLAKQWHPDRFSGQEKAQAEERFRCLAEAFSMLKDENRRQEMAQRFTDASSAPQASSMPPGEAPSVKPPQEKTTTDWLADAQTAIQGGDLPRAMALIQHVLRLDPQCAQVHVFHAHLLEVTQGDPRTRIKALETAIRLNPKDADSMLHLADAYDAHGMQARASHVREDARKVAPKHPFFVQEAKAKPSPKQAVKESAPPSLGEQLNALVGRFFKKG